MFSFTLVLNHIPYIHTPIPHTAVLHLLSNEVIRMQQVSVPYLNVECGALSSVHPQVKLLFPVWVEGACHNLLKRGIELNKKKPTYRLLLFSLFFLKFLFDVYYI